LRGHVLKISIVTPNLNGGAFLPEAIDSVLSQVGVDLEYIVVDGGSVDISRSILKQCAPCIDVCISEPDRGQSEAINKGFRLSTGEVMGYLNSDDNYTPNALNMVLESFSDPSVQWLAGSCTVEDGANSVEWPAHSPSSLLDWLRLVRQCETPIAQQSVFWRRDLWNAVGPFREDMHYAFDLEYWLRLVSAGYPLSVAQSKLSRFRLHPESKSATSARFGEECRGILREYGPKLRWPAKTYWLLWRQLMTQSDLTRDALTMVDQRKRANAAWLWAKSVAIAPWSSFSRRSLGCLKRIICQNPQ